MAIFKKGILNNLGHSVSSGGGTGEAVWGGITGTLANQLDLKTALDGKEPTIPTGTASQYIKADKTIATLDKAAVGLGQVDNTSDLNKPISTDTQTALNLKLNTVDLVASDTPTQNYIAKWDTNKILRATNFVSSLYSYTTGGNIGLSVSSNNYIYFAGTSDLNIALPAATTLQNSHYFVFINNGTGNINVKNNSGTTIENVYPNSSSNIVLVDNSTANGVWFVEKQSVVNEFKEGLMTPNLLLQADYATAVEIFDSSFSSSFTCDWFVNEFKIVAKTSTVTINVAEANSNTEDSDYFYHETGNKKVSEKITISLSPDSTFSSVIQKGQFTNLGSAGNNAFFYINAQTQQERDTPNNSVTLNAGDSIVFHYEFNYNVGGTVYDVAYLIQ